MDGKAMQTRPLTVPKGKGVLTLVLSNHTYVLLRDEGGEMRSRSDSAGKHVSFVAAPGRYALETDGRIRTIRLGRLVSQRSPKRHHAARAPKVRARRTR